MHTDASRRSGRGPRAPPPMGSSTKSSACPPSPDPASRTTARTTTRRTSTSVCWISSAVRNTWPRCSRACEPAHHPSSIVRVPAYLYLEVRNASVRGAARDGLGPAADDVPDGGKKHFEIMGYDILVVRLGDRFFCVDAACTYKWAMLTDGLVDRDKLLITCKDCNGSWDLQTGQPKELPAKFPLTSYRIESVADDLIVTFTY